MKAYLQISVLLLLLATCAESLTDGRNKLGALQSASRKNLLENQSRRRNRQRGPVEAAENCAHWYKPGESKEKFMDEYMKYCWSG
eukprot:CAMPEP_0113635256 /NCGR_PEP_ID=MMETSP0017_2-20120614/18378_1 /TAXON_ID=2856 /ORGANISM="Cylindrotheca closterium" /LENGTH=84 /DNA_ID=CAMNT_0000546029 /DNA_START=30 /DNA_END=284 /DNA_ORIENTATION=+ /assembly_acc=CAM_ASM_000147